MSGSLTVVDLLSCCSGCGFAVRLGLACGEGHRYVISIYIALFFVYSAINSPMMTLPSITFHGACLLWERTGGCTCPGGCPPPLAAVPCAGVPWEGAVLCFPVPCSRLGLTRLVAFCLCWPPALSVVAPPLLLACLCVLCYVLCIVLFVLRPMFCVLLLRGGILVCMRITDVCPRGRKRPVVEIPVKVKESSVGGVFGLLLGASQHM